MPPSIPKTYVIAALPCKNNNIIHSCLCHLFSSNFVTYISFLYLNLSRQMTFKFFNLVYTERIYIYDMTELQGTILIHMFRLLFFSNLIEINEIFKSPKTLQVNICNFPVL